MKFLKILVVVILILAILSALLFWRSNSKLQNRIAHADEKWTTYQAPPISDFGSTSSLKITPLVDWHTANETLKGEMGVSYLLETDSVTILFDLGCNMNNEDPSPLEHNMQKLGITIHDIDIIVISHNHFDHVGGMEFMENATFGLNPNQDTDLSGKRIYTPIDMSYPGTEPKTCKDPTVIAPGVATIGTIPRALFFGDIDEQALAINLEGKGLVLIVGCSHQTIPRIIERTEKVFSESIYGLLGGFHYPVPKGRFSLAGIDVQRRLASGNGPMSPLTMSDVESEMEIIAKRNPGLIGIGGHDSSDEVIKQFTERFGEAYHPVKVGLPIILDSSVRTARQF